MSNPSQELVPQRVINEGRIVQGTLFGVGGQGSETLDLKAEEGVGISFETPGTRRARTKKNYTRLMESECGGESSKLCNGGFANLTKSRSINDILLICR